MLTIPNTAQNLHIWPPCCADGLQAILVFPAEPEAALTLVNAGNPQTSKPKLRADLPRLFLGLLGVGGVRQYLLMLSALGLGLGFTLSF